MSHVATEAAVQIAASVGRKAVKVNLVRRRAARGGIVHSPETTPLMVRIALSMIAILPCLPTARTAA